MTPHKNNGETDSAKLSDETSSLQTSSNQSFFKEDTSRLFDNQTSETSHGNQNVVINSNGRSKSSKKSPVGDILHHITFINYNPQNSFND